MTELGETGRGPYLFRLGQKLAEGKRLDLATLGLDLPAWLCQLQIACLAQQAQERPSFEAALKEFEDHVDCQLKDADECA
jgi:hypothetical protein